MPRIKMKRELFEIRTICALISQKKIIIMKIQKSIFTLFVFAASTIFAGCNTDQFDVAPEKKIAYTDSEKAQIYALAEKYELEVVPMEQSKNQSLKSVSELEETFKAIYKQNNTKIPLFKTKDGSYTTRGSNSSARIKTRSEASFTRALITDNGYFKIFAKVQISKKAQSPLCATISNAVLYTSESAISNGYLYSLADQNLTTTDHAANDHDSGTGGFNFSFTVSYKIKHVKHPNIENPDDLGTVTMSNLVAGIVSLHGGSYISIASSYTNVYGL